jgi:hypothetical protein
MARIGDIVLYSDDEGRGLRSWPAIVLETLRGDRIKLVAFRESGALPVIKDANGEGVPYSEQPTPRHWSERRGG